MKEGGGKQNLLRRKARLLMHIETGDCPLHARDMTCSEKEKENSNRLCCLRNRATNSSVVNSGGLCGHRFRRIFIYYRGRTAPGTKICRYNKTYVITNYVISVKVYINDTELEGTTRFFILQRGLCYIRTRYIEGRPVYIISNISERNHGTKNISTTGN